MKTRSIPVGSNVYIYGTGNFAERVADRVLKLGFNLVGFVDHLPARQAKTVNGVSYEVFQRNQLPVHDPILALILGVGNGFADIGKIYEELLKYLPEEIIYSPVEFSYFCGAVGLELDCYWMQSDPNYYIEHSQQIIETLSIFEDEESRVQFLKILKYREFGNLSELPFSDLLTEQYLPRDLNTPPKNLRMVDLGACKGENLEFFVDRGHIFEYATFFEPDYDNFVFLADKLRKLKIENSMVLPLAAWSETKLLTFDSTSDSSSHLQEAGDSIVQSVKLSDFLATTKVNYIKMDIEGAEYEALLGLEQVLIRDRPHLAVSVDHKPDDMFKIGLWLKKNFGSGYKFYLRTYNFQSFDTILYCVPRD